MAEYHSQELIQSQLTELFFEVVLIDNIRPEPGSCRRESGSYRTFLGALISSAAL